jgi:hypothetical protein
MFAGDDRRGRRPRLRRGVGGILGAAAILLCWCVGTAAATTGALELVHPPRVVVPFARAAKFQGRFVLDEVGSGAHIRSGGMKIEFSPGAAPEFLIGAAQFYLYNASGQIETALFTIFPFRSTADGVTSSILKKGVGGPDRTPSLGTFVLKKPVGDKMEGTLELHASGPYRVVFSKLPADAEYEGKSPPAKQLKEPAGADRSSRGLSTGWGPDPAAYLGEYALTGGGPDRGEEAGLFGPLISVMQAFGPHGFTPTGGELTVLRGEVPTAEVEIDLGSLKQDYYLTDLSWRGSLRVATVRAESPTGPKVGRFEGTQTGPLIEGTIDAGGTAYQVGFEHR